MRGLSPAATTKRTGTLVLLLTVSAVATLTFGTAGTAAGSSSRAPANGLIAYDSDRSGGFEIYTMNPDGTNQTKLTSTGFAEFPNFSPDGTKIAYDDRTDIFVMNTNGSSPTNLTGSVGHNRMPSYSPDGSKIAFVSDRSGVWHVWTMNSDGSNPIDLTKKCRTWCTQPAYSPDGTKIAFASNVSGTWNLWVMNANGTGKKDIYTGSTSWPSWSPDGKKIAIVHLVKKSRQLWVMRSNGTGATRLATENTSYGRAAWSPDGTRIAFARRISGDTNIWSANVNGTGLVNLTGPGGADDTPSWQAI